MELIVMRLQDMHRVHPKQIKGRCSQCKAEVAIYPSGQKVMQDFPDVRVVCSHCRDPGAREEASNREQGAALLAPTRRARGKQAIGAET
jgi:hypothetical protein